jgi:3-oxoacyl-[acyl-carrier-protein] synthase II
LIIPKPVIATRRAIAQLTTAAGDTRNLSSRIVVTGIGLASPIGLSVEEALNRLLRREPGSCRVPNYQLSGLRVQKNQKFLSASARHLMWAGLQALEHSGWTRDTLTPGRTGMFAASGQVGLEPSQMFPGFKVAQTADGTADWAAIGGPPSRLLDPYFSLRALANSGLALLAMEIGARGPTNNFVQSDTAAVQAVDTAMGALEDGLCDVAICGAFDSLLSPANELNYRRRDLVSARARLKPFDAQADGIVLAEGGAAVVLERRQDAGKRGAMILAEIERDSSVQPDFAVAAGHGLPCMDREEAGAIDPALACTAFKGATGYLGAATALVEVVLTIAALQARVIPNVVGLDQPAEGLDLDLVRENRTLAADRRVSALCMSRSWMGERAQLTMTVD